MWLNNIKEGFRKGIGFCLALACIIVLIMLFFIDKLNAFAQRYVLLTRDVNISDIEKSQVNNLYSKEIIMPASEVLNHMTSYYDTFITILVALIGVSALAGYAYIKTITRKEAEQEINKAVSDYFARPDIAQSIESKLTKQTEQWANDLVQKTDDISVRLNNLDEKIELIRSSSTQISDQINEGGAPDGNN